MRRRCGRTCAGLPLALALYTPALAATLPGAPATAGSGPRQPPDPAAARAYVESIRPAPALQAFLDHAVADLENTDPALRRARPRVAVIDLTGAVPLLAQVRGDEKVYPASTVKFVYLMAAYAWQERGRLTIDPELDTELSQMIRESSNGATQKVFARLTDTEPGPELDAAAYAQFRDRRLEVERWLQTLGIHDLHAVSPTYDGDGDLFGRDRQFLRDRSVKGGLEAPSRPLGSGRATGGDEFPNRQAMTASGTARLLALLATDRALTATDSATVRQRMKRDVREQPHLVHRIAGGAAAIPGAEAYSKSGTWGPIYSDAGIVRDASGKEFVIAVFTESSPPYRGEAIAQLTRRTAEHIFGAGAAPNGGPT